MKGRFSLKNKVAVAIVSFLVSLPLLASPPDVGFSIDLSHPTVKFEYTTFAGNTPSFPVEILTNDLPYNGFTGYTPQFNYFPSDSSSAGKTISGTLSGNIVTFTAVSNSFPVKGEFFAEVFFILGSSKITAGQGTLHIQRSPSGGSYGDLNLSPRINWDAVVNLGTPPWAAGAEPVFFASAAYGITATQTSNWTTAWTLASIANTGKVDLTTYNAHITAQANSNAGYQANINTLNGLTNGLATTNQLLIVSNLVVTAQSDITNNLANQVLTNTYFQGLHTAQANTNTGFETRIVTVETGKMSLATQNSTNANLQTQITLNLTNQNATNTLLQTRISSIGTGTWSLALLKDGSRAANYLNIANTNYLGGELVTNGTFTGSASNWSLSTFYYNGNRVILNPSLTGQIEYTNTMVITTNKMYELTVETTYADAAVTGTVGGVSYAWTSVNGEIHKEYFYAISNGKIILSASTGTNSLEIDNVTLKECSTGSLFVAQNVNAGNSVWARVGVYAPNITAISNDLDTAETDISGLKTSTGTLNTAVGNLKTATNALNSNKLNLSGGIMTGPLTNNVAYYGNGVGLTNISASSTGLAWSAITDTPTNYGVGGYGILDIPAATTSLEWTAISNTPTSLDGYGITNNVGDSMTRYYARTNANEKMQVLASGAGIVVTRTNELFNFAIPAGVHLFSCNGEIDGGETDSGIVRIALGTNDVPQGAISTMWISSANGWNKTSYAYVTLVPRPDPDNLNLIKISGFGTQSMTIFGFHLVW